MSRLRRAGCALAVLWLWSAVAMAEDRPLADLIGAYTALYDQGSYEDAATLAERALALGREELGDGDPRLSSLLRDLAELDRARERYEDAERRYLEALAILEQLYGDQHPEVAQLLIDLTEIYQLRGRLAQASEARRRAMAIDAEVLAKRGFESGRGVPGSGSLSRRVIGSVYDFFERNSVEVPGYGRYTYVLFARHDGRNARLLEALMVSTPPVDAEVDRRKLNVFYVPVKPGHRDAAYGLLAVPDVGPAALAEPLAGAYYDHSHAAEILARLCSIAAVEPPRICATALSGGPYLLTLPGRFAEHEADPGPYLIADLSAIHPDAFAKFLDAIKVQVREPDFTDLEQIASTRLALLSIILDAADILTVVKPAVAEFVQMVGTSLAKE